MKTTNLNLPRTKQLTQFDESESSFLEFIRACKSKATKKTYTDSLNRFMAHEGYNESV